MGIVELNWEAISVDTNLTVVPDDIWRQRIQEDDIDTVLSGWLYSGLAPVNFGTFYIDPMQVE